MNIYINMYGMNDYNVSQGTDSQRNISGTTPKTFSNDSNNPNTWNFDRRNSKIKSNNGRQYTKVEIGSLNKNQNLYVFGDINHTGSINNISDKNFKQNIVSLSDDSNNLLKLNPVSFNYLGSSKTHLGFIAQEVETIYPDLVSETKIDGENEGTAKVLNLTEMIPLLVYKIKEMDNKIKHLSLKNKKLEHEIISSRDAILRKVNTTDMKYENQFKELKKK